MDYHIPSPDNHNPLYPQPEYFNRLSELNKSPDGRFYSKTPDKHQLNVKSSQEGYS